MKEPIFKINYYNNYYEYNGRLSSKFVALLMEVISNKQEWRLHLDYLYLSGIFTKTQSSNY